MTENPDRPRKPEDPPPDSREFPEERGAGWCRYLLYYTQTRFLGETIKKGPRFRMGTMKS
jgi:hypothetical protein